MYVRAINICPIKKEKERKAKRSRAWKTHNALGDTIIRATNQYAQLKKQITMLAIDHDQATGQSERFALLAHWFITICFL